MNAFTKIDAMVADAYSMANFVYVDIETIPTQSTEVMADLRAAVKPPASLKKQESIDAWLAENADVAAAEAAAKTSFDGGRGHVCTISWAVNDGETKVAHASTVADEAEVIEGFFDDLRRAKNTVLVGHNLIGFDLPFLRKRAICLGVPLPSNARFPRDPKPWDKGVHDTMVMWAGARDTISMDRLCNILGLEGKGGFDGSQVARAWAEGRHEEIAAYCTQDVERTRALHQRFLAVGY